MLLIVLVTGSQFNLSLKAIFIEEMIKYQVVEKTLCKTCANNVHLTLCSCFVADPFLNKTQAQMNTVSSPRVKAEYIN